MGGRQTGSDEVAEQIERVLGVAITDRRLRRALGRLGGVEFERLEFLGDPVLEHLVSVEVAAGRTTRAAMAEALGSRTTDRAWLQVAEQTGLRSVRGTPLAADRAADLVEACAGAALLSGGWPAATAVAEHLGIVEHPPPGGRPPLPPPWLDRPGPLTTACVERALGVRLVEPAWLAHALFPDDLQGVLALLGHQMTELVAADHLVRHRRALPVGAIARSSSRLRRTDRVLRRGAAIGLAPVLDGAGEPRRAVHALLGAVLADQGRRASAHAARRLLGLLPVPATAAAVALAPTEDDHLGARDGAGPVGPAPRRSLL